MALNLGGLPRWLRRCNLIVKYGTEIFITLEFKHVAVFELSPPYLQCAHDFYNFPPLIHRESAQAITSMSCGIPIGAGAANEIVRQLEVTSTTS